MIGGPGAWNLPGSINLGVMQINRLIRSHLYSWGSISEALRSLSLERYIFEREACRWEMNWPPSFEENELGVRGVSRLPAISSLKQDLVFWAGCRSVQEGIQGKRELCILKRSSRRAGYLSRLQLQEVFEVRTVRLSSRTATCSENYSLLGLRATQVYR